MEIANLYHQPTEKLDIVLSRKDLDMPIAFYGPWIGMTEKVEHVSTKPLGSLFVDLLSQDYQLLRETHGDIYTRGFSRCSDGSPLYKAYPDSTIDAALENIHRYGVERNPKSEVSIFLAESHIEAEYAHPREDGVDLSVIMFYQLKRDQGGSIIPMAVDTKTRRQIWPHDAVVEGEFFSLRDCLAGIVSIKWE